MLYAVYDNYGEESIDALMDKRSATQPEEAHNQSTSRIRPHDTGPDYTHGPGCLCRYCDNK